MRVSIQMARMSLPNLPSVRHLPSRLIHRGLLSLRRLRSRCSTPTRPVASHGTHHTRCEVCFPLTFVFPSPTPFLPYVAHPFLPYIKNESLFSALVDLARCTRREADAPSEIEVDPSQLPSALLLHGLDWPFMSELERAQWKGRSLQQFRRDFDENVTRIADASLDAAQAVYRTRPGVESEALRRRLRKLSTAVHLDSGSAVSLVFEALQLFAPVLEYAAIEGRPSEAEEAEAMREREAIREALL